MKLANVPEDLNAEVLANYLAPKSPSFALLGPHKRNAYRDILSIENDIEGHTQIGISRKSLYDILPEALFHPFNRFDNLPANNYEELFAEECRKQREEEESARAVLQPIDLCLFHLNCLVHEEKERYGNDKIIADIICDKVNENILHNRFVKQTLPYIPLCKSIRGNRTLLSMIIRKTMMQEGLELTTDTINDMLLDDKPRYNCFVGDESTSDSIYLGNQFTEDVAIFRIKFWSEDDCDDQFLQFVKDMKVYQDFLNDFFMGIETKLVFELETDTLPVRLSDDLKHNYMNYNTNI